MEDRHAHRDKGGPRPGAAGAGPRRRRAAALAALIGLSCGGWYALHRSPAFAAAAVNAARAAAGPGAVAWLEDQVYKGEDAVKRATSSGEPARYWGPAEGQPAAPTRPAQRAQPPQGRAAFPPAPFAPPFDAVASPDDGRWTPLADRFGEATIARAMVHPDPRRSFAVVAVVALDLRRLSLGVVHGTSEPNAHARVPGLKAGLVPEGAQPDLVAAFNGGFMAIHGRWGMMIDGVTVLPPRPAGCTVARFKDGSMRVATFRDMAGEVGEMSFFRQTPPCLVERGEVNAASQDEDDAEWGTAVGGSTFIRRSAFGLSASGEVAFYAIGDSLSAATLGRALLSAGAHSVAQLDVNWAYPHFFFYQGDEGSPPRAHSSLITAYGWTPKTYVERPDWRDFFFVTRRAPAGLVEAAADRPRGG